MARCAACAEMRMVANPPPDMSEISAAKIPSPDRRRTAANATAARTPTTPMTRRTVRCLYTQSCAPVGGRSSQRVTEEGYRRLPVPRRLSAHSPAFGGQWSATRSALSVVVVNRLLARRAVERRRPTGRNRRRGPGRPAVLQWNEDPLQPAHANLVPQPAAIGTYCRFRFKRSSSVFNAAASCRRRSARASTDGCFARSARSRSACWPRRRARSKSARFCRKLPVPHTT